MNGKPRLEFVDTNILVYVYDVSSPMQHSRAKEIMASLWQSGNGCLSVQVLQEFYVTATRKIKQPLSAEVAAQIIGDLGSWSIFSPTTVDVVEAIRIHRRYQVSYWDAMIIHAAQRLGCSRIWSEDLNTGQMYEGVRIVNPF